MNNIKHVFFDLDHTLWDFDKNSQEALNEIYNSLHLDQYILSFDRFLKKYREINNRYWHLYSQNKVTKEQVRNDRFVDTLSFFNIDQPTELGHIISEKYVTLSPTKTNLFPDTHDVLKALSKTYKLHIITNGFVEVQHIKLKNSNLKTYFDVVVCSEETGKKKPHKDVFNLALQKAKAKPENALMVGDNLEADVLGSQKAGMSSIWFNPTNQKDYSKPHQTFIEIKALNELKTILKV